MILLKINLSEYVVGKVNSLFDDETDAANFIAGTVQLIYEHGVDKAIKIFSVQADFAACQLAIAIELAQKVSERTSDFNE